MEDFLFFGDLSQVDPDIYQLTQIEAERQVRKLILIPSESTAPAAVRELLGSVFQNLYAKGIQMNVPAQWMRKKSWITMSN